MMRVGSKLGAAARNGVKLALLLLILPTGISPAAAPKKAVAADMILRNGAIYLVEPEGQWAQAVAIASGRIIAIGSNATVDRHRIARTKVVDLKGRMAMPGLIDNHLHLGAAAAELRIYNCPFSNYGNLDAIIAAVRACAKTRGPDEWIVGQHWSSTLYGTLANRTALKALDDAAGGRPVMLRSESIHDRWVNSRALAIARITRATPDPLNGHIGKDETGEPNGLLLETAGALVERYIPALSTQRTDDELGKDLISAIDFLNSQGVTAFHDAKVLDGPGNLVSTTITDAAVYHKIDRAKALTAHVAMSMLIEPTTTDLSPIFRHRQAYRSDHLSMDFAKIFVDGVQVSRTGYFLEPYLADGKHPASYRGEPRLSPEKLNRFVTELDAQGISVKMHVSGDAAIRMAIDAIASARRANGDRGPIHTLAHAGFITPDDLARAGQLRAAIDASPTIWYPGPPITATEAAIGTERARKFFLFKSYDRAGVMVVGGSDWKTLPGEFSDLWDGMEGMVTRRNPTGATPGALDPEEAVSVAQMIRFYTINPARAMMLDRRIGSITIGKDADIIVLDQNLFKIAADRIARTKVDMTFFGGKLIYERRP